jgi:thioredoxin reductase (NADPH)
MEEKHCDLIIIGTGPAGLSAAIYCQRQGLSATVFGDTPGGNLYMIESVKNYPGFNEGVPGMQLGVFMYTQAQLEGANFTATNVDSLEKSGKRFVAKDASGNIFAAPVALIAAGSTPKRLNVQNAALDGIHYCAMCDGPLYRGKDAVIIVVGAGERGGHLCVFLSKIAKKVILVDKAPILNMSASLQKAVALAENVEVLLNTEVQAFIGEDELKGIQVSSPGGQTKELSADGLFLSIGWVPNVSMIRFPVAATPEGFLKTDAKLMTSCAGLFAAGDVRDSDLKQIITACADGARAATYAAEFLQLKQ